MCGIIGTLGGNLCEKTIERIKHRGPDNHSIYKWKGITLGHVRLSIVDLSEAGNQPMHTDCGNYSIIFNGEIYNHEELRSELSNIRFKGHSDTETILYYLREKGINSVKMFNGIFSFAFLDKKNNQVYLVRDPFGVKPLYYYEKNEIFHSFGSEIRALEQMGAEKVLDYSTLTMFLRLRYYPSPFTMFKNIRKLPPGTIMQIDIGRKKILSTIFFGTVPQTNRKVSVAEALEQYDHLLRKAVKRQLMSDVPLSLLLSGGVDSALLAKLVMEEYSGEIQAYTAGFSGNYKNVNEVEEASFTANYLSLPHKKVVIEEKGFIEELPRLIEQIEEPLGSQSIYPIHFLSKSIHEDGYKVTLTGQGVDEPWGGYKRYNVQEALESLSKLPLPYTQLGNIQLGDSVRRALKAAGTKDRSSRFMESYSLFDDSMLAKLLNNKDFDFNTSHFTVDLIRQKQEQLGIEQKSAVTSMMTLDARMNLADDLLLYTDKISMKHSIEMRVPFLDIELMYFVESLPHTMKVGLFKNKWLHKKLAEKYLPKEIIHRKKKGFYTPRSEWFKGTTGMILENRMMEDTGTFSELFNKSALSNYFKLHRSGKVNYEKQLYLLIVLFFSLEKHL